MARKVTGQAIESFVCGKTGVFNNTSVELSPLKEVLVLKLHGNVIARRDVGPFGAFEIQNAGWLTNVTKERLNGLPGVNIHQKNFEWFLNGEPWDGCWTWINR